ncbi:hypothetical protein AMS68_002518 [Peltaster fructicola]|uniref:Major facilitator superfamily (MFS) profile domain-containing protein n=1 Tax=Peltaster fructicola TaxID=286661 RepID=A0A6H0XQS3_9PEZI|nr:hypothetical protein AMS68_002518 [Peltaster fructicola]
MAPLNVEDQEIIDAERDASPERWADWRRREADERHNAHMKEEEEEQHNAHLKEEVEEYHQREEEEQQNTRLHEELDGHLARHNDNRGSVSSVSSYTTRSTRRPSAFLRTTSTQVERDVFAYLERHPTAIQRMQEHRLQHSETVGTTRSRAKRELPDFGGGKPYPPPLPDREEYVTEFNGYDDPEHPQNWPFKTKLIISSILILSSITATLASSIFSPTAMLIERDFNVGQEVTVLGTSLFVLGYALGPCVWAPLSELYGRRVPTILAAFMFGVFEIGVSTAKDIQTVMICRFFSGFAGSAALTMCPSVFADIYSNKVRGVAIALFSATVFNGPLLGPMLGGFISKDQSLGWRWTQYIPAIMAFSSAALALFFQRESYGPVILVNKAAELRRLTKNWGIHAKQDEVEVDFNELITKNIGRPFRILFTETIVLLITIYMSFLYGILYLSLTAYSIVFGQVHGFSLGVAGLPFMGLVVGVSIGLGVILITNKSYVKKLDANNNVPVPEWRLAPAMLGGISFAIGLFWFGWTGYTNTIPWIVPTLAGIPLGLGIYLCFISLLNYILDAYLMFAASAVAANTIMRSLFGAVFPLFATYMFDGLGVQWAMTLLGCVAALLTPMPFIFYHFGKRIRATSKFAPAPDVEQDKQRDEESRGASDGSTEKKEDEKKDE